jgi:hypothetical protein
MVMVGTLQCRHSNPFAVERYNEFVERHRGFLDANARILKAHFAREAAYVPVQDAYDKYATELSNIQSAQNSLDPDFCGRVDLLVRTAASSSQSDLLSLAQAVADEPVSGPCAPSGYAAAEPAKPAGATLAAVEPAAPPGARCLGGGQPGGAQRGDRGASGGHRRVADGCFLACSGGGHKCRECSGHTTVEMRRIRRLPIGAADIGCRALARGTHPSPCVQGGELCFQPFGGAR